MTITQMHRRYVFEDNEFSDAGIAIQYYGTAIEHVAVGNRCSRAGGFHGLGIRYTTGIQPDMYCQWLGNEIVEGNSYRFGANNAQAAGPSHIGVIGRTPSVHFGAVVRENRLRNNATIEVMAIGAKDVVEGVLVEGNEISDSFAGIRLRDGVAVLCRGNKFQNCRYELLDIGKLVARWRQAAARAAAEKKILAWWKFDSAPGGIVTEAFSEAGLNLKTTLHGNCKLVPGLVGKALKLDGNSFAQAATDDARMGLNLTQFTIAAWIYPERVKGRWGIISKRTGHQHTPFVLAIRNGCLVFEATDSEGKWTSYNFSSPPLLKAGKWQHVAVTVREGKQVVLYLDGKPIARRELQGQKLAANEEPVRIGREAWGGDPPKPDIPGFFKGMIDEVKIWPWAMTAEEIQKQAVPPSKQ